MHNQRQARKINRSNCSIGCFVGIFLLGLIFSDLGHGQALTVLNSFSAATGSSPVALIEGRDGNYYGTDLAGGSKGEGSVFTMSSAGVVTILHTFGDGTVAHDGATPTAGLIEATNGNFYGTTSAGGSAGKGAVFMITSMGVVTILHSFSDGSVANDGALPRGSLVQGSDNNLYGTTSQGGSAGEGTVFQITLTGTVTILHNFGDGTVTNDGASPSVGLASDGLGDFYGTTPTGGAGNVGAVFEINSQKQASILYSFAEPSSYSFSTGASPTLVTGPGGFSPNSRLTLGSDGNLYGTTAGSGYGYGTIFKVTPQGQETVLHYFGDGTVANDGRETVQAGENILTQGSDGNFYGTTGAGGLAGKGALFEMTSLGQMTILHCFGDGTVANDGADPVGGVIEGSDGAFYGTSSGGGTASVGTIFKVVSAVPAITSSLITYGAVGVDFSSQTVATQTPTGYSASGLPAGLSIDSTSGLIFGIPSTAGSSNVILTVTNAAGSNSVTLVIDIVPPPAITSILSAFGSTAGNFGYQITASGTPTSFAATGLPGGLSVDPVSGIISGTPSATGTFSVTISATNVAGSDNETLTLVISSTAPALSDEYVLLHSFEDGSVAGEGSYPGPLLVKSNSTFSGVTAQDGATGSGTIFNLSAAGDATVLSGLGGATGATPQGLVEGSDGNFYGTTQYGGSANLGTVFMMTPAGVMTVLHVFGDGTVTKDGANPQGGVIEGTDGNFYGTTQYGGSASLGTIFEMSPKGVVTILHSFGDGSVASDGAQPVAALVEDNGVFYGTTISGGSASDGTVFAMSSTDVVTILHSFGDGSVASDGQLPHSALVFSTTAPGTLYGTTVDGGTLGKGTIYSITTKGVETILHNFGDGTVANDGINPISPLVIYNAGGTLTFFGTTENGGSAGEGAVYELDSTNALTILHSFDDGTVTNDGQIPLAGLSLDSSGNLYGTTVGGGAGSGTIFAIAANLSAPSAPAASTGGWSITGTLPLGLAFDSTTGTISGTPSASAPAGGYVVTITSPQNVTSTQVVALTQTYAQWAGSTLASQVVTSSPMKDGVPNLLKYLTDINPTTSMTTSDQAALPTLGVDTTSAPGTEYMTLSFRQSAAATGVSVVLETSTDLQNWQPVDSQDLISKQVSLLSNGDSMMEMGVKVSGAAKQFIRLNVTTP